MNRLFHRIRPRLAFATLTLAGLLLAVLTVVTAPARPAEAIAPCVVHTPSGDELSFLASLQAWRNANIPGSLQLTQSAPLNAAAEGYAQFVANTPGAGGHSADGSNWNGRAVNCGYPANIAAGGEGIAVAASASQALSIMTAEGGGGVHVPSSPTFPIKCVGVGKAVSSDGSKTVWVTLLFGTFGGECPGATTGGPPPTVPASSTASTTPTATYTATPTKTATPSPTPTASPTPRGDGAAVTVFAGWNLVTLPPGPAAEVLHRANGCYRAIYQQQGDRWLRYAPEAPSYANNLHTLNGGTYWVEGTAANCGVVPL